MKTKKFDAGLAQNHVYGLYLGFAEGSDTAFVRGAGANMIHIFKVSFIIIFCVLKETFGDRNYVCYCIIKTKNPIRYFLCSNAVIHTYIIASELTL